MSTAETPNRFLEIDVLRGLAAFWVMLSHYFPHWHDHLGSAPVLVPGVWGLYAVELFFVISGFVIFATLDRCSTVGDFVLLRFSRLYPAYWITLSLTALLSVVWFGGKFWLGGFLVNLTMLQEFFRFPKFDEIYWSLAVELAFYLNAAWLFALGWHRRVHGVLVIWLAVACVWALIEHPVRRDYRDWFAVFLSLDYAPYFALGILFYDATKRGWSRYSIAVVLLAAIAEFLIAGGTGILVAVIIGAIFYAAVYGYLAWMVSKPTLWLGAISYSLYLVHHNLGYETLDWLHARQWSVVPATLVTMTGALLLATLVTYLVEKPALRVIRVWYERRGGGETRR